jgi:hypothetical protein
MSLTSSLAASVSVFRRTGLLLKTPWAIARQLRAGEGSFLSRAYVSERAGDHDLRIELADVELHELFGSDFAAGKRRLGVDCAAFGEAALLGGGLSIDVAGADVYDPSGKTETAATSPRDYGCR